MQLVTPNLGVPAQYARCLKYVQDAFGSPNAGKSATYAWNQTQFKHTDKDFPQNVYFLVWFSYWGTVDGVYDNWGHVVICKDGICYSSPYSAKTTHDVISSISEVERIYGCTFVGWSEDIAGLKVIEGEPMIESSHQARMVALEYGVEIAGDDPFLARAVGQTELVYRTSLGAITKNTITVQAKQIADMQVSNPDEVKVTKTGLWDWFKSLPFVKK